MKKFLLTSCAILSAIGVQAQTVDFEYRGVEYEATLTSHRAVVVNDTTEEFGSTNETAVLAMDIHTITSNFNYYDAAATDMDKVTSATIATFEIYEAGSKSAYVGNFTTPQNYYSVGTAEYTQFFEDVKPELLGDSIKTYTELQSETGVTAFYYWEYDEVALAWRYVKATGIEDANLNRNGYYKRVVNGTRKIYYLIRQIGVAQRNATTTHRKDSCIVTKIEDVSGNKIIQSITIGKDVNSIEEGAFFKDPKLNNFTLETEDNFIYENGILYNKDQTAIIVASCDVQSQTIPATVSYIYESAFYNTKNAISITSMNGALETNSGTQGSNVTFVTPSANLTITADAENGGYIVTGNVTQSNFDAITQTGTYFDFRGATIMENLSIDNQTNTIYYFATTANVSGNNVVNNGTCENFVLKDSYRTSKFYCPISFTATHASYDRVFDNCWSTMCIPFSVDGSVVNGNLYCGEFRTYNDAMALFSFLYSTSITANTPYIVRTVEDDQEFTITAENTTVYKTAEVEVIKGNASFFNNYEPKTIYSNEDYNYFGVKKSTGASGNPTSNIVKLTGATVNSFRTYLKAPFAETNYESAKIRLVDAMDNEIEEIELPYTTSIEKVENAECEEAIYDLNGQMQKEVKRGLNIVNGKVVINK